MQGGSYFPYILLNEFGTMLSQNSVRSDVVSAVQLNTLLRLLNKQHLIDAFSKPDYWLLNFQESRMRLKG